MNKSVEKKIFGANSLPCCKVCQCENGKKIWCACHRKQIEEAINNNFVDKKDLKEKIEGKLRKIEYGTQELERQ